MTEIFRLLAVLVACYVAFGLVTGEVYAKSGVWGRSFRRDEGGLGYWSAIGAYALLALMLGFVF
jgi:hypothetical protein